QLTPASRSKSDARKARNLCRKDIQGKCGVEARSSQLSSGFAPEKLIRQFESTCAGAAHWLREEKAILYFCAVANTFLSYHTNTRPGGQTVPMNSHEFSQGLAFAAGFRLRCP